ncbi:MAG: putative lipid II flippase FtsW [Patescibacteria group bacterium]|nr:putative lipid II flippase FtsW [Patescibacteria group bacterium]
MRKLCPPDKVLIWLIAGLTVFGLVMLTSASGPLGYQKFGDSLYFLKNQLTKGLLPGTVLFALFTIIDYRKLRKLAMPALIISILLLILVFIPGLGVTIGGSSRWVNLGPFGFQPSELVKVTFLLYVAAWLASRSGGDAKTVERGLVPFLSILGVVMFLLVVQPNTGSMIVIAGSALLTYFIAGAPFVWFMGLGAAGVGLVAILIKLTPYRAARFMTFLHPELDPQGIGYHINQAFLAIGSGGLFGLGYGHSRQKYLYLPEVAGDSVFAVMAEEMGFFIMLLFIVALGALVWKCFSIARNSSDEFGTFLATGIGGWIALQSFFNIGSMIGLVPMTGVTLPFVSYGSSAFIALCVGCGMVASISRQQR